MVRGAAWLSPDGETIHAIGKTGMLAISTRTLSITGRFAAQTQIDGMALSPDGALLYGLSDTNKRVYIVDTTSGESLGVLEPPAYPAIVRVEQP